MEGWAMAWMGRARDVAVAVVSMSWLVVGCTGGGRGGPGPGPATGDLSGTWEVTWMDPSPRTGVVEARDGYLRVQFGDWTVRYEERSTGASTTAFYRSAPSDLVTTHVAGALDSGQIPLDLGGDWSIRGSDGDTCTASVGATAINTACASVRGLPAPFPRLLDGTATVARTSVETSIFGDLGGSWHVTPERGSCDALVAGSSISLDCRTSDVRGSVDITFGNGVASGNIDGTLEFAARRL